MANSRKLNVFARFALATSYITIIPLGSLVKVSSEPSSTTLDEDILSGLAKYLPAVGLLLGALLAIAAASLNLAPGLEQNALLKGVIITTLWLVITGGLHFDGLMDTADGIFSHRDRGRMLEIMQDPRAGNFAVITGVAVFAMKAVALASLFRHSGVHATVLPTALLLIPAWARFAEAYAIGRYPYAKPEGKGRVWHETMKFPGDLGLALILPLLLTAATGIFISETAFYNAITVIFAGFFCAAYLNSRLGGHTGDTYGTVVEVSETISLIALALLPTTLG
ncbi:MAG: adenosylcobinamide-GDP ribazoletransferase [Cyanobacteria bacterium REEB67]|nr:adenosylcobinamide-GDP ribazoletransferase [Cyanobacteria bacterium REEB67]